MNITKEGADLVVRIPLAQEIYNCYDENEKGTTDNLVGVISGDSFSISHLIDLSYKGSQQEGCPIIMLNTEEELREVCKKYGIQVWTNPVCDKCKKVIYGSFTCNKEYEHLCFDCEHEVTTKDILIEILAKAESCETAREVRHIIKEYILCK
jgi:hypothetical protein